MNDWYPFLRHLHIVTAIFTATLMLLRLGLEAAGVRWRHTALRWLPHVNDTLLLAAALALVGVTGWSPFAHHWLSGKIILLFGYIVAGKLALDVRRSAQLRRMATFLALAQLAGIFWLALAKPM